jgi:hypothetical protein
MDILPTAAQGKGADSLAVNNIQPNFVRCGGNFLRDM